MGASFQQLPPYLVNDILERIVSDQYIALSELLSLRLVSRIFNTEVCHFFYDKDIVDIHYKVLVSSYPRKPTGVALQKVVQGFISRKSPSEVLNLIRKNLREGALVYTVLASSVAGSASSEDTQLVDASQSISVVATEHEVKCVDIVTTTQATEDEDDEVRLPASALLPISKAYIDIMGEEPAFDSLDTTWARDPDKYAKLDTKSGLFWALLAAAYDGTSGIVKRAIHSCRERFRTEEDDLQLKMHLAGALLIVAKHGHVEAAEIILAEPAARISLRFQNIRFSNTNAIEAALESNQQAIVQLLLDRGWTLTTVPADYIRALRGVTGSLEDSDLHRKLLLTLLEGDCQQWRSASITTGILQELSKRGDLATCKKLVSLLQNKDKTNYDWKWSFDDTNNNDNIISAPPTNLAGDDEDEDEFMHFHHDPTPIEEKSALFHAVSNDQNHMIKFLLDNRSLFPDLASENYTRFRLRCFEHAIQNKKQESLTTLLPYIDDICPQKLFLYAIVYGNLEAMQTLYPRINLTTYNDDSTNFWNFMHENSKLSEALSPLDDHLNPGGFLWRVYHSSSRSVNLGTFALVIAIKFLQIPATKFLLERNCEIGTRLIIFSPSFTETRHARLIIPQTSPNDDDDDSDDEYHPSNIHHRLGRWVLMFSLRPFTYMDMRRMAENGTPFPSTKTRWISKPIWRKPWKGKGQVLKDARAKIITCIQIPYQVYANIDEEDDREKRLKEMRALMRKWKLPHVSVYHADDNDW